MNLEKLDDGSLRITGWAVANQGQVPAEFFLLSIADDLSYLGYPSIDREDIVEVFDSNAVLRSGFSFTIPSSRINFSEPINIGLIGISDSNASSIGSFSYLSNAQDQISLTSTATNNFRLASDTEIVGPNEDTIELATGEAEGSIDVAELRNGIVRIAGWAANLERTQAADYFLLQIDQQLLYLGTSKNSRPDVATSLNSSELENSGFLIIMEESLLELESSSTVRLIAVTGNQAIEVSSITPLEQMLRK